MNWTSVEAIKAIPKAELHAHLTGCMPSAVVRELLEEFSDPPSDAVSDPFDFSRLPILESVPSLVTICKLGAY